MFFGIALIVGGWGLVGWGRKSYSGSAEVASFSRPIFSQSNKHDKFWHVIFLWAIVVSDFRPLEIYKNLCPPLPIITFTVESHEDNHSYKYIYLFQILYSMKSVFLLRYRCSIFNFKVFYIQTWFTYEAPLLFFQIKTMIYRRKHYRKKYERILIYMLYTHGVTCSLSRWNNGDNDICKKYQWKFRIIFRFLSLCVFASIRNIDQSIPLRIRVFLLTKADYPLLLLLQIKISTLMFMISGQ